MDSFTDAGSGGISVGNAATKLLIAAEWAATKSFDVEAGVLGDESTCRAGADEGVLGEFGAVVCGPGEQLVLHVVVSDKRDALRCWTLDRGHDVWGHAPSVPERSRLVGSAHVVDGRT